MSKSNNGPKPHGEIRKIQLRANLTGKRRYAHAALPERHKLWEVNKTTIQDLQGLELVTSYNALLPIRLNHLTNFGECVSTLCDRYLVRNDQEDTYESRSQ